MSEHIPQSSVEYAAEQRRQQFDPHPCIVGDIEWHFNKNLMMKFDWNGRNREVNLAPFFRKKLGKLTEDVRKKIIATKPETVVISTRVIHFAPHQKRYIHEVAPDDLEKWLDRVQKENEDPR